MKMNVSLDLDDFFEHFNAETLDEEISLELKAEIMKIVKKDVKYKAFVSKQATKVLDNLEI